MTSNYVFPSYTFYPSRLEAEKEMMKEKYEDIELEMLELQKQRKLPDLLAKIRKLTLSNSKEMLNFANNLKGQDVKLLAYSYPYEEENIETVKKIAFILHQKYTRFVGRIMWENFQLLPKDEHVQSLVKHAFKTEDDSFLSYEEQTRRQLNRIIAHDQLLREMAVTLSKGTKRFEDVLKDWKVTKDTQLYLLLMKHMLLHGIHQRELIVREGSSQIVKMLNLFNHRTYLAILKNYLSAYDLNDLDYHILSNAVKKLDDPRKNKVSWQSFDGPLVDKVKRWLMLNELKKFFENDTKYDRFQYWKKYIRTVKDVKLIKSPPIAIMEYDRFTVVEFARTGNAAYFYETEGFNIHMSGVSSRVNLKEDMFKDKKAHFFIQALPHSPPDNRWHSKYDRYMNQYLKGNLRYV